MMAMYNPPHPGEFVYSTYMEPFGLSCRFLASKIGVAASTLNRDIILIQCIAHHQRPTI